MASRKYLFERMAVGDYFTVPDDMGLNRNAQSRRRQSVMACARQYQRNHNPDFKVTIKLVAGDIYVFRVA